MFLQTIRILVELFQLRFIRRFSKNILLIAEFGKSGGTRTYFFSLAQLLYEQGYKVSFLVNDEMLDEETILLLQNYSFGIIPCKFDFWCTDFNQIPEGLSRKQLFMYQLSEIRFWCSLQRKYHFSKFIFSVGYPGQYQYSFLLPVQIVYIIHTEVIKKADKYRKLLLKFFVGPKKQIITVSDTARKKIIKYWFNNDSNKFVHFVYNYYTPRYLKKDRAEFEDSVKRILTIGSVEAYKNPYFFIEVAKKIIASYPDEDIRFIWTGEGSLLGKCIEATTQVPQIQFIGHTENVEELYAVATIYFQPSLMESHGISVVGAMYHHIPCVVSDQGGLKESVKNEENGYVVSLNDIADSVEKISRLLLDENLRKRMGAEGYRLYGENFTKEKWAIKMKRFI